MEAYLDGVISMGKDTIGESLARKYLPLVATIGIFVFISNVIGIIPGLSLQIKYKCDSTIALVYSYSTI